VRLYRESDPKPVIKRLAEQWNVHPEALRNWIRQAEADAGERADRPTTAMLEENRRDAGSDARSGAAGWSTNPPGMAAIRRSRAERDSRLRVYRGANATRKTSKRFEDETPPPYALQPGGEDAGAGSTQIGYPKAQRSIDGTRSEVDPRIRHAVEPPVTRSPSTTRSSSTRRSVPRAQWIRGSRMGQTGAGANR
jgi:transposase-like protein